MLVVATETARAPHPFALVGETLAGRFRIERLVAEGGFGVVYRAQQIALDRAVALKVLKPPEDLAGEAVAAFHRTFETEARTVARLKHAHIVEVHDFGVSDGPSGVVLHWMAMEWLEGRTLDALLGEERERRGPPRDPARALELLRPVLQAIAFAHREGVVHRDLKPGNILLAELHGAVVPKVLDFGIAQMLVGKESTGTAGAAAPGDTTRGPASFSPDYAAPEQVSYGRTGPWTDVHALGLILTEVLTGERPYPGAEAVERFSAAVSERRPTPGNKGVVVGQWESVLARALARRPTDRYSDANALLQALEQGVGKVAGPLAAAPAIAKRSRARRLVLIGAALAALAVLAAGSYVGFRQPPLATTPGRVMLAVLPFANLSGDPQQEYFSDGLTEGMISQLGRLAPERLAVIGRSSVQQYKVNKKTIKEIGRELGCNMCSRAACSGWVPAYASRPGSSWQAIRRRCGRKATTARSMTCSRCRPRSRATLRQA
jgi:tRNA A-37 threonylcarbamoyl transferase component Bud32